MFKIIVFVFLLTFSQIASAVTNGSPANGKQFQFVRLIQMIDDQGAAFNCTGSLLANGMVLTAAHCVIHPDTHKVFSKIKIIKNHSDKVGTPVLRAVLSKGYDHGNSLDFAILYTAIQETEHALLPVDYAYKLYLKQHKDSPSLSFPEFLVSVSDKDIALALMQVVGTKMNVPYEAYAMGFGLTCLNRTDCPTLPDVANYLQANVYNSFIFFPNSNFYCTRNRINFMSEIAQSYCLPTEVGRQIQHGDSGGPLFVFDSDASAVVIGVINSEESDISYGENLAADNEFFKIALTLPGDNRLRWIDFQNQAGNKAGSPRQSAESSLLNVLRSRAVEIAILLGEDPGNILRDSRRQYDANVSFYGKAYTADMIANERLAMAKKWPTRSYTLRDGGDVSCSSSNANVCRGTFIFDWFIQNGSTTKHGSTQYTFGFDKSREMRVTYEVSKPI